jgi:GNAT superfamily N-acetyltransferase
MKFFSLERVCEGNVHEFIDLLCYLARYERIPPPDDEARARLVRDVLSNNPKIEAFIGRYGDTPVGCVTFCFAYSTFLARPTLFIEDLFVLEEFRGKGFGRKLFEFCRSEARARECGRMEWMVLSWNEPSIRFYEKAGGKKIGWDVYRIEGEGI